VVWQRLMAATAGSLILLAGPAVAAKPPDTWDGLTRVKSRAMDVVYLQPGADFRGYTKVMLDPTEVTFHKNWRKDHNATNRSLASMVSERDVQTAITKGVAASNAIFAEAWTKGGYAVVTEPGADVLRIKTGVVNVRVSAPETNMASRSLTFAPEAGDAVFFVEARDSLTGAILGRAVDQRFAGDNFQSWRTSVSNRADFRDLVESWAREAVRGVDELKRSPPVTP